MKKGELLKKKITELRTMAKELGLSVPRTSTKEEIAALIAKTLRLRELRSRTKKPRIGKGAVLEKVSPVKKISPKTRKPPERVGKEALISGLRPVSITEEITPSVPPLKITKDILGLVPVSPQVFYLYWELSGETVLNLRQLYPGARLVIRVYEITGGKELSHAPFFEIQIPKEEGGLHIEIGKDGEFVAELGINTQEGTFISILRSNRIMLRGFRELETLPEAVRISFPAGIVHPTSL